MPLHNLKAVLFDLDGTLLDTAPDLAAALNNVLANEGHAPLPLQKIRPYAGHGSRGLLQYGLGIDENHAKFNTLSQQLLDFYSQNIVNNTHLFPGMEQVLTQLENKKIPWGIVTNKPGWLTQSLLEHLQLTVRAACVVSGDTLPKRKPDPAPLLHACAQLQINPSDCIYIGDSESDMQAGARAGMPTALALYGYIPDTVSPLQWGANYAINNPLEILELL